MPDQQVKSKKRVADHGEVFTAEREVKAMCDLVDSECQRIDSRFLEPACGEGAFLTEILRRKLAVVKRQYGKSPADFERYCVMALSSIYGVELLPDNAAICRGKLFAIWDQTYTARMKKQANDRCREIARYLLRKNILCGDALTLLQADGSPIIFAEWSFVTGSQVKRRDFRLDELMAGSERQVSMDMQDWEYDPEADAYIPRPIREYPLTDYRRVDQYA